MTTAFFSGSYRPHEVRILLQPQTLQPISILEKEQRIQSGQQHYSTMLSPEIPPSPRYLDLFQRAVVLTQQPLAQRLLDLAAIIAAAHPTNRLTLVSLARAGTPIGVLLWHIFTTHFHRTVTHYSISILRDRGIDHNALNYIVHTQHHSPNEIVFIDGWIGKGAIAQTLKQSIAQWNQQHSKQHRILNSQLFTITDLAGVGCAPTNEDILIPSSLLNATISGLISRSIHTPESNPLDFHGCVFYSELTATDVSIQFIDTLRHAIANELAAGYQPNSQPIDPHFIQQRTQQLFTTLKTQFNITDRNRIKPGIGEATRVLLRRIPERLIIRDSTAPEVAHLLQLAQDKQVQYSINTALPYHAVSLIKSLSSC